MRLICSLPSHNRADVDGKKKRKQQDAEEGSVVLSPVVIEMELLGRYILSSVRECCVQDTNGEFVDEVGAPVNCC